LESKKRFIRFLKVLLYCGLFGWALFLGRYHSLYGLGVFLVLVFFGVSIILGGISMFVFKTNKANKGLNLTLNIGVVLFTLFVGFYYYDNYKPTVKIIAPTSLEGCVYIFQSDEKIEEVIIDSNGIGYIEFGKEAVYDFYIGDKKINDVLKTGGYNNAMIFNKDTSASTSFAVQCYNLNKEGAYPKEYPYVQPSCLEWDEFIWMVEQGWVDSNRVKIYRRQFEPIELLQRKRAKEFRVYWPTNLQTGEVGALREKPLNEKIYKYFKGKYDTVSSKLPIKGSGFNQSFGKGINYTELQVGDTALFIKIRLPKTNLSYTKKAFAQFFKIPEYQFNYDSSMYLSPQASALNLKAIKFNVEAIKDSVYVEIHQPWL